MFEGRFETNKTEWQYNLEVGIKFAVNTNNPTLKLLGYIFPSGWAGQPGFIGGRLGILIRKPFGNKFESIRLVYEFGTGSW